jgi:hypothetical protein
MSGHYSDQSTLMASFDLWYLHKTKKSLTYIQRNSEHCVKDKTVVDLLNHET